jgi:aspartate 1-decarboxylase
MYLSLLKCKLHGATVTDANLNYEGSIGIPRDLMDAAGLLPHERVDVLNFANGARLTTYVLEYPAGSGHIVMNGPAAHLIKKAIKSSSPPTCPSRRRMRKSTSPKSSSWAAATRQNPRAAKK